MKTLFSAILLLVFAISANAQKKCTNETLSITMNTSDTVHINVRSVYVATEPIVSSTVWGDDRIALTKKGTVNSNKPGTYTECYTAIDNDGLKVECCRIVVVKDQGGSGATVNSLNQKDLRIFPNPLTGNNFTLIGNTLLKGGNSEIKILTLTGEMVLSESITISDNLEFELPTQTSLKSGCYILSVKQNEVFVQAKIMVL
jgi:hypothetical protein